MIFCCFLCRQKTNEFRIHSIFSLNLPNIPITRQCIKAIGNTKKKYSITSMKLYLSISSKNPLITMIETISKIRIRSVIDKVSIQNYHK